jgi:biotin carboxyl carrier protein
MNEYVVTTGKGKKDIIITDENTAVINGKKYDYELTRLNNDTYILRLGSRIYQLTAERVSSDTFSVFVNGNMVEAAVRSILQEKAIEQIESAAAGKHKNISVKAPMPGMILKIKKQAGEIVKTGESVVILEAMKMENDIHSPAEGIISNIAVQEGSAVEKGAVLFLIE